MATEILYLENDATLTLTGLTDKAGEYINDAVVTITIFDLFGVEISGDTWPADMDYVAASNGNYLYNLDDLLGFALNTVYKAKSIAIGAGDQSVYWKYFEVRERAV